MAYTGTSIVDYLKSVGKPSDYASRAKLATQYGIQGYGGNSAQNTQLLGLIRGGTTPTAPTQTSSPVPNAPTWSFKPAVPNTDAVVVSPSLAGSAQSTSTTISAPTSRLPVNRDVVPRSPLAAASQPPQPVIGAKGLEPQVGGIPPANIQMAQGVQASVTPPVRPTVPMAVAGTITTPSGVTVNPATGGVVTPPSPATPAVPETPTSPIRSEPFTSQAYESAVKDVETYLQPSAEEVKSTEELNRIAESLRQGYLGEAERPIPLPFITGRQAALERRVATLAQPLQAQATLAQAKRVAALEASKFKVETEGARLAGYREAAKPVSVSPGTRLINPLTGQTVAEGASVSDQQALETFFNLAQTYPDASISWNQRLSPQQNLAEAQRLASASPSFQAKGVIYAINPLTGEPTIISKREGTGTVFGGGGAETPATTGTLQPELRGALSTAGGVQYFDQSKVTSTQLPYLQRASQELGIPLLSKEDANKVQEAFSSFNTANALITQITGLATPVLKAQTRAEQVVQAAKLKAIEIAPALSEDNEAKQFISARNSMLSLLTRAAGEKGVLTTQDVERISQAMPGYSDNAALAAQKAANFSTVVNSVVQGAINAYIGNTGTFGGGGAPTGGGGDALDAALDQARFRQGGGGTPTATRTGARTDRHNNPTALAWSSGVEKFFRDQGYDVKRGDKFPDSNNYTLDMSQVADPVRATIDYINEYGFYYKGKPRWTHTAMSEAAWNILTDAEKSQVVKQMYEREGGTKLASSFQNYG